MLKLLENFISWVKSVYSDNGVGSSTRVHIGMIISFVLLVGISFSVAVHIHKISIEQFNNFLSSAGTFIVTTTTPLYAANQAGNWLQKKEDNKNQQPGV
jgi:hypothetical protein